MVAPIQYRGLTYIETSSEVWNVTKRSPWSICTLLNGADASPEAVDCVHNDRELSRVSHFEVNLCLRLRSSFLNVYIVVGGGLFFVLHRCGVTQRGLPIGHGYGILIIAESLSIQGAFLKCPLL